MLLTVAFGAAFATATTWSVDKRALDSVTDAQRRAAYWWEGLVQSGIPPDSATQLTLNALRSRLNGSPARVEPPFVSRPVIDSVWQAFSLNPFLNGGEQTPRNDREHESLRVARQDIRLVLAVGTEAARRREFARAQRLQAIVLAGIAVLSISTLARRRSSRPTPNPVDTISVLHYFRVMKNVTITLDDDVARWARIRAAELDTSVSRMLGELLRQQMRRQITYQTERQQYLVREARPLSAAGSVYPSRDDLHDRSGLR